MEIKNTMEIEETTTINYVMHQQKIRIRNQKKKLDEHQIMGSGEDLSARNRVPHRTAPHQGKAMYPVDDQN
jgi:hypothetical protein